MTFYLRLRRNFGWIKKWCQLHRSEREQDAEHRRGECARQDERWSHDEHHFAGHEGEEAIDESRALIEVSGPAPATSDQANGNQGERINIANGKQGERKSGQTTNRANEEQGEQTKWAKTNRRKQTGEQQTRRPKSERTKTQG